MNYFLITLLNLLMLLALVIPGFVLRKTKIISRRAAKDFSNVLLYIGTPFLIIKTTLDADFYSVGWVNIVVCIVLSIVVHILGVVLGYVINIGDKDKARKTVCMFTSTFSNCGFLGIPLAYVVVPPEYLSEALLYVAIYNVVFNFLTWLIGMIIFTPKESRNKKSLIKAIINPCTIGFLFALPFALSGVNLMEVDYIGTFISHLAAICVPVSMFVLGFRVAGIQFPNILKNKYVYKNAVVRLVLVPLITFALAVLLRLIPGIGTAFITAMVVMASMPTAASALAFAEKYDADAQLASETVITSTLLSIISVPLMLLLVSLVI